MARNLTQSTPVLKLSEIDRKWYIIDATDIVVGRLSTYVSLLLQGKDKGDYTEFLNAGSNIIIINANKAVLTGKKFTDKIYYRHTGHPGGIKSTTPKELTMKEKTSEIIKKSVKGMLGRGPLARDRMRNLYIYEGSEHPHQGQQPVSIDFGSMNPKNTRKSAS